VKFGYAIIIALVALVAVTGFASADRLPQQVPENQIFTVDTLLDVTGSVSDESSMQWTLDSQNLEYTTVSAGNPAAAAIGNMLGLTLIGAAGAANQIDQLGGVIPVGLTDAQVLAALRAHTGVTVITETVGANTVITYFDVPANLYNTLVDPTMLPGVTFQTILDQIAALNAANAGVYDTVVAVDSGSIHDTMLNPTEEIMILTWTDSLRSNGGKLSLNKNIDFDSQDKGKGLSNLEVEKVFTYASTEGAHLVGAEEWTLDVAGSWEATAGSIRCVFATASSEFFPAFCNVVKAKSELVNINSAQVSTKGAARSVAATGDVPAALSYQIAVTPDSNSGSGFADGTVKTLFAGSIMEARDDHLEPSATNNWKDTASFTGGIKNFQKTFNYESGFTI